MTIFVKKYNTMKKLLLLLFLVPMLLFSQKIELDEKTGLYAQTEVLEFEGLSKDDLFNKTIEWVTLNYNSANDVVQLKDLELGKIIVKGNFVSSLMISKVWIYHTLILEFKDNRIRYTYTNFSSATTSQELNFENKRFMKAQLNKSIQQAESNINVSIKSLIEFINTDDSNDW